MGQGNEKSRAHFSSAFRLVTTSFSSRCTCASFSVCGLLPAPYNNAFVGRMRIGSTPALSDSVPDGQSYGYTDATSHSVQVPI